MGSESRMLVYTFFREHPVHAFKVDAISKYLKLTPEKVDSAIKELVALNFVEPRFQFATAELPGLVDEKIRAIPQALHKSKGGETDMTEDTKKVEAKDEKMPESMIDTAMRVLKKDHNWKIFAGIILGWFLKSYIGW